MRMPKTRWILVAAAVTAAAAIVISFAALSSGRPEIPLYEVKTGSFARQITAEGALKASRATPLAAPIEAQSALKVAWIAPDGAPVRSGECVVRFDPTEFEEMLRDGKTDRSSAVHRIDKTAALSGATKENLKRDAQQASRELDAARNFQLKDAEVFSRSQRIESEIDETLASKRREYSERVLGIRDQVTRAERGMLAIDERKADIKVHQATTGLGALEVRAPHDGILVLARDWKGEVTRVGQTVWAGEPIGEIPDLATMKAEIFVLEADAGGLAVGQEASVTVESDVHQSVPARVARVDAVAKPRVRNVPVQYFGVTLTLDRTDPATMKPGARVRARLRIAPREGVLTVPLQAVFERAGKKIVYLAARGRFEVRVVEVGPSSLGRIVVLKGIRAGDRIALRDPAAAATAGTSGPAAPPSRAGFP